MDGILGIDVARKVHEEDMDVRLVFCTTSNEFACESYEVDRIENGMFVLKNGDSVPISRRKTKEVTESYAHFCFEQMRKGDN